MNFLQWLWAMMIFAGYTDPAESSIWTAKDLDADGEEKEGYIFFATTRPIEDEEQVEILRSYGWTEIKGDPKKGWQGSLFRHDGW